MTQQTNKLHPLARTALQQLKILKTDHAISQIDFTNSTNPFGGDFTEYPSNTHLELKALYLKTMANLENKRFPTINWDHVTRNNILFTVGSVDGLDLVLKAFCDCGHDTLGFMHPSFSAYAHFAKVYGLKPLILPLQGKNLSQIDLSLIHVNKPKMVILCTPNNPTGTELAPDLVAKVCESFSGIVVVDEAYHEYGTQPSSVRYINKYKNLIILRTLSKAWGMAALRIGVVIADALIIETLKYVQTPFPLATPAIEGALKTLPNVNEFCTSWEIIAQERDALTSALLTIPYVTNVYPSHANFVFFTVENSKPLLAYLDSKDMLVVDASNFMPNAIKVSVSHPRNNLALINALYDFSMPEVEAIHQHG
jgi:histidinol-phosphate aminotransferase